MSIKQVSDLRKVKRTLGKNPNSKTDGDGRCDASTVKCIASTVGPKVHLFTKHTITSTVEVIPSTVKHDSSTVEVSELDFTIFNTFLRLQIFLAHSKHQPLNTTPIFIRCFIIQYIDLKFYKRFVIDKVTTRI